MRLGARHVGVDGSDRRPRVSCDARECRPESTPSTIVVNFGCARLSHTRVPVAMVRGSATFAAVQRSAVQKVVQEYLFNK